MSLDIDELTIAEKLLLSGKQIRFLRGLGHHLNPVVSVGKQGLTDSLLGNLDEALTAHELVKVKLGQGAELDKKEAATELAARTGSVIAQIVGKTILLYRENPKKKNDDKIKLPRGH